LSFGILLLIPDVFITQSLLVKVLELPDSVLLSLTNFRESFSDEHNIGQVVLGRLELSGVLLDLSQLNLFQVVAQHSIVVVQIFSQVRAEVESLHVRHTEVFFTTHFNLTHLEFVFDGGSRDGEVCLVQGFYVDDYEF
jgi:hypothetical protein